MGSMVSMFYQMESLGVRMSTIGDRLRWVRGQVTMDDLAEKLQVHRNTVARYENGDRMPDANYLNKVIEKFQNINPAWLLTGEGEKEKAFWADAQAKELLEGHFMVLTQLGGETNTKHLDLAFSWKWLHQSLGVDVDKLAVVLISGDAMSPTLNDGDVAIVNVEAKQVFNAGVYVVKVGDTLHVRRMQRGLDGTLTVRADNPIYQAEHFCGDDSSKLDIAGRVIWVGRKL